MTYQRDIPQPRMEFDIFLCLYYLIHNNAMNLKGLGDMKEKSVKQDKKDTLILFLKLLE